MNRIRTIKRLQRRTCPCMKTNWQHRTRVSEGEHSDTSQDNVRVGLLKSRAREDEAGPSSSVDVHRELPSTSGLSSDPEMHSTRTTSRLQRRTFPYIKTVWQHRTRVSEGEHSDTSLDDVLVRLLTWTASEDEAGRSSSVDIHRENLISSAEDESKRDGKSKLTDDEEKRRPDLDLTETKDDKLCTPQNFPAHVQRELPGTSVLSSEPKIHRTKTTRRLQRRTYPYTETDWQHRTRVSEGEHSDTSLDDVLVSLLKMRAREDKAGPSSSVDVHRENLISSAKDESKRGGKRKKKRSPDLDLTESEDDKLCTPQNVPAHVQTELPSTSGLSSVPKMDGTRRLKGKTCPYKKTVWQPRTRVSKEDMRKIGGKRKKKSSPDLDLFESEDDKLYTERNLPTRVKRAAFEAKYQQEEKLGEGGCGYVFAGYRKADNLPIAIKYIPSKYQCIKHVDEHGNTLPGEVAILLKLTAETRGSAGSSAPVSLLDWYDLEQELILVLERPDPCMDMAAYIWSKGGSLREEEAKIILKQLVDALIELQDKNIFHRDIKVENILIETGSDVLRVRLIDFGLSCFVKRGATLRDYYGTPSLIPPEWYNGQGYSAGPTTAWQVGVVVFQTLHRNKYFETLEFLQNGLMFNDRMSEDCKDFLLMCLIEDPEERPTLEQLKNHPWLR